MEFIKANGRSMLIYVFIFPPEHNIPAKSDVYRYIIYKSDRISMTSSSRKAFTF